MKNKRFIFQSMYNFWTNIKGSTISVGTTQKLRTCPKLLTLTNNHIKIALKNCKERNKSSKPISLSWYSINKC